MSITLDSKTDHRGSLYPFNLHEALSFNPKRLFFIRDVPAGTVRGHHAHINTTQVLLCVAGLIEVHMENETEKKVHRLFPGDYVLETPMTWTSMNFVTNDSILLVLSSEVHNEADYIRDIETYRNMLKKRAEND